MPRELIEILHGTNNTLPLEIKQKLQRATDDNPEYRYAEAQSLVTALIRAKSQIVSSEERERGKIPQVRTQTAPSGVRKRWQTGSERPSLVLPEQTRSRGARGLKQKVTAIIGYAIVVTLMLLGSIAWTIVQSHSQPAYLAKLGGLDLNSYCQTYGYNDVTADLSFCSSPLDVQAACNWAYSPQDNIIAKNESNTNPYGWNCYTSQGTKLGGLSGLTDYCYHKYHGASQAQAQKNGTNNGWLCEQNLNYTIVCIWQFDSIDVQARMENSNWNCYGLS